MQPESSWMVVDGRGVDTNNVGKDGKVREDGRMKKEGKVRKEISKKCSEVGALLE